MFFSPCIDGKESIESIISQARFFIIWGASAKKIFWVCVAVKFIPQKSNIDTKKLPFSKGVTFSKAYHFGALQPLVFRGVFVWKVGENGEKGGSGARRYFVSFDEMTHKDGASVMKIVKFLLCGSSILKS